MRAFPARACMKHGKEKKDMILRLPRRRKGICHPNHLQIRRKLMKIMKLCILRRSA